ncbi:hypothetical protein WJX81_001230 [Elliptochloris bilobata]|uniref:Cupin-like domain-containing protein n=1 Tax=Elliptochloris bilobata TaxID=381761 RepID=A0AAW1RDU8_9CHLO
MHWCAGQEVDANTAFAAWEVLRGGGPAVLRGTPLVTQLLERWTLPHLAAHFGGRRVTALCAPAQRAAVLCADAAKNVYGGLYHVREPESQALAMGFGEAAECIAAWQERRALVRAEVMRAPAPALGGAAGLPPPEPHGRPLACGDLGAVLREDLTDRIGWQWLQEARRAHRWGSVMGVDLELASGDLLQPARYSTRDRLLVQIAGRRRVLLLAPAHVFAGLYPFPVAHPYDGYAMPDLERPDAVAWPALTGVRGCVALLRPGDVLFVPAFWFAHVQDMDAGATSLAIRLGVGMRLQGPGAAAAAAARRLEERVGAAEGIAHIRRWLLIIAHNDEARWIDTATVAGYRRVVMCQEARDEVEAALAPGERGAALLLSMCERRLLPTPWLNKSFREPLYLTVRAIQLPDTRTDEQRRFPELFPRLALADS